MKKEKPTKPDMLDKFSRNNIFDSDDSYRYMYCTYVRINPTHNSICCGELWKPVRDCQRNWIEAKIIEIILVYILMTYLAAHWCKLCWTWNRGKWRRSKSKSKWSYICTFLLFLTPKNTGVWGKNRLKYRYVLKRL